MRMICIKFTWINKWILLQIASWQRFRSVEIVHIARIGMSTRRWKHFDIVPEWLIVHLKHEYNTMHLDREGKNKTPNGNWAISSKGDSSLQILSNLTRLWCIPSAYWHNVAAIWWPMAASCLWSNWHTLNESLDKMVSAVPIGARSIDSSNGHVGKLLNERRLFNEMLQSLQSVLSFSRCVASHYVNIWRGRITCRLQSCVAYQIRQRTWLSDQHGSVVAVVDFKRAITYRNNIQLVLCTGVQSTIHRSIGPYASQERLVPLLTMKRRNLMLAACCVHQTAVSR